MICFPLPQDVCSKNPVMEPHHTDENLKLRRQKRQEHKKLLKQKRRRQIKLKAKQKLLNQVKSSRVLGVLLDFIISNFQVLFLINYCISISGYEAKSST